MSFTWCGISSDDIGVRVEHYPNIPIPVRRQTMVPVPGRSGGILITEPAFDNVILNYDVFISESANMAVVSRSVLEWLLVPGYQELTDSYDTGVTRYAYFDTSDPIESTLNRFGRVTLAFNAKPERYITEALTPETHTANFTITNPTLNTSKPLIIVHGDDAAGYVKLGENRIRFTSSEIVIDGETQQAYLGATNMNNAITEGDFPTLAPGSTRITFSENITSVEIAPRWFYL